MLAAQAAAKQKQQRERAQFQPGSPRQTFVPGIAPTTKGTQTRTLLHRMPSEGHAAELHVPGARPAWYGDDPAAAPASATAKKGSSSAKQGGVGQGHKSTAAGKTKSSACVVS